MLIVGLVVLVTVAWCKIAKRLGYDSSAGFLMIIPIVGHITLLVWAFNESPNERKLRLLQFPPAEPDPGIAELLLQIDRADPPLREMSDPL